jgi:ABC-type sugar transport system permease subunit
MIAGEKRRLGGWWGPPVYLLAPGVILFLGLFGIPAVSALYVSMNRWSGFTPEMEFTGLRNFVFLFTKDDRLWYALGNNFFIMTVGGVAFFTFAFLFATALNNRRLRGGKFFQTMIFFPSFISIVGVATYWKLLYDSKNGLINMTLRAMGLDGYGWLEPGNAMGSIIIMMVWGGVGGTMILLLAGMRRIPKDYYEAAEIDGASAPQQFFRITVPMMREVIVIVLSLWMINSMKVFGAVQAMMIPDISARDHVISTLQYEYAFSNRKCLFMMGRATAMAIFQLAIVLGLVGLVRLLRERKSVEY